MVKRNPISQTKHEQEVKKIAEKYKRERFKVKASLPLKNSMWYYMEV